MSCTNLAVPPDSTESVSGPTCCGNTIASIRQPVSHPSGSARRGRARNARIRAGPGRTMTTHDRALLFPGAVAPVRYCDPRGPPGTEVTFVAAPTRTSISRA
ncbi:hypothetical protein GCM10027262_05970 [Nocardia tengchongensis]